MPHPKYCKILSKQIVKIINNYILPNKIEFIIKYNKCLIELRTYFKNKIKKNFNKLVEGLPYLERIEILNILIRRYELDN